MTTNQDVRMEVSRPSNWPNARARSAGLLLLPAIVAAAISLGICGCKQDAAPPPPPPSVVVMDIAATNVPLDTEFIGQLDSPQNVEIRARVEGFVDQMLFIEGTNVNAGDPLFKLDDKPYQERLKAAKGS